MYFILLFLTVFALSFGAWIVIDDYRNERSSVISGLIAIVSGIVLVISLIGLPISRLSDSNLSLKVDSYRTTLVNVRQMSEFERVALAKDILEINADIKQRQYWAHSKWYNWFHNIKVVDSIRPL